MKNKRVRVEVTAEDIENGRPSSSCFCPVALALKRALGLQATDEAVALGQTWVCSESSGVIKSQRLPQKAHRFVVRFDERRSVRPFTFTLTLPGPHGDALGERKMP